MKIHYEDIFTKKSECGIEGEKISFDMCEVTCMECLKLIKKEWERQKKEFTGYPRINAVRGLKRTIKRIKEINKTKSKEEKK